MSNSNRNRILFKLSLLATVFQSVYGGSDENIDMPEGMPTIPNFDAVKDFPEMPDLSSLGDLPDFGGLGGLPDLENAPDITQLGDFSKYGMKGKENNNNLSDGERIKVSDAELNETKLDEEKLSEEESSTHDFATDDHRIVDLIINNLYSNKEIAIRELLSNCSDALEKSRILSLTDAEYGTDNIPLEIKIDYDKENNLLMIKDTGVGMTKAELISHLGTVARSGTQNFEELVQSRSDAGFIGQFGVGFYSAFLIADRVQVISKSNNDDQYIWTSTAQRTFTITKDPRGNTLQRGTMLLLRLKEDSKNFGEEKFLKELVKKFSQFISYPIYIRSPRQESVTVTEPKSCDVTKYTEICKNPDQLFCHGFKYGDDCCEDHVRERLCCDRIKPCCADNTNACCEVSKDGECCNDKENAEADQECCKDKENVEADQECCKQSEDQKNCCKRKVPCCSDGTDECCNAIKMRDDSVHSSEEEFCKDSDEEYCTSSDVKSCCKVKEPVVKTIKVKVDEWLHINSKPAIWRRSKDSVTVQEYNEFYKAFTGDYSDPLTYIHFSAEGEVEFKAILFIPAKPPSDLFENYFSKPNTLKLYSRRILVSDNVEDILPRYFQFFKGVVESDDLPLNVSRENLQQQKIIRMIRKKLIRKILEGLRKLSKDDNKEKLELLKQAEEETDNEVKEAKLKKANAYVGKYDKFYEQYSRNLKLGCYEDSSNRTRMAKLLKFPTSLKPTEEILLETFVEQMPAGQSTIYYASGDSIEALNSSPQMQYFIKNNIPVLYFSQPMDEPSIQQLKEFEGKKFASVQKADIELDRTGEEKKREEKLKKKFTGLLEFMEKTLQGEVMKVEITTRLVNDPCAVVTSRWGQSAYMEKIMKTQTFADPRQINMMRANRIFEVNPNHAVIIDLFEKYQQDKLDEIRPTIFTLLYVATISSGFELNNPAQLGTSVYGLMMSQMGITEPIKEVDVSDIDLPGEKDDKMDESTDIVDDDEDDDDDDVINNEDNTSQEL